MRGKWNVKMGTSCMQFGSVKLELSCMQYMSMELMLDGGGGLRCKCHKLITDQNVNFEIYNP